MFTSQIERALKSDSWAGEYFKGVYPCDKLPQRLSSYPASVVANTDPSSKPGAHWIAFYFDENAHLDYFDSYGMKHTTYADLRRFAENNSTSIAHNNRQLQGLYSDVCGQYCIAFICLRSRGRTLNYIKNYYSSGGRSWPGKHDDRVRRQIANYFNIKTDSHHSGIAGLHGGGHLRTDRSVAEQCSCCAALNCSIKICC